MKQHIVGLLGIVVVCSAQAQTLVAPGTRATLTVDYSYTSAGTKPDRLDPRDWNVTRKLSITTQLVADAQLAVSTVRPMEPEQAANLQRRQQQAASAATTLAPMAADMMKIAEKCNEDEACIEREVMAYASGVKMTPDIKAAGANIAAASQQGAPRYQLWKAVSETQTWSVDEVYNSKNADPICASKPNRQCTRREIRKGQGNVPASKNSGVILEVDSTGKRLTIGSLPAPLTPLMYAQTITTDHPEHRSGTSQVPFAGFSRHVKSAESPVPSGIKTVSGSRSIKIEGTDGEGGTLVVNWRFALQ